MLRRALVVEDEPTWRHILGEILSDLGFEVDHAASFEESTQALNNRIYDLAVIDVSLAEDDHENRDGIRLLSSLRQRNVSIPALMISAHTSSEISLSTESMSAFSFISKSDFDRDAFAALVMHAIAARQPMSQPSSSAREPRGSTPLSTAETAARKAEPASRIRVLVVEDDRSWVSIYRELLAEEGYEVQVAVSYGEALGWLRREPFALAVVDLKLISSTSPRDNRDGFRLLRYTHQIGIPTLVVSALGAPEEIEQAYDEYEIFAFFDKEGFDRDEFLRTARAALSGAKARVLPRARASLPVPDPLTILTNREREVLALLAQGLTNRQIAERLVTSPNTVKKQVVSILSKLGVHTRAAAARLAVEHGLVK
ncbi:MAG: response regulator [Anaerolineae bacterium]|nr:response regulator [Anaerolineae bacterium]MDW8101113.1 response regulator [Anaerolineae bacterium]